MGHRVHCKAVSAYARFPTFRPGMRSRWRVFLGAAALLVCACDTAPGGGLNNGDVLVDTGIPDSAPPEPEFRIEPGIVVFDAPGVLPVELINTSDVVAVIALPADLPECGLDVERPVCVEGLSPIVVNARSSIALNVRLREPILKSHDDSVLREFVFQVTESSASQTLSVVDQSPFWSCDATLTDRTCTHEEASVSVLCSAAAELSAGSTVELDDVEGVSLIEASVVGSQIAVDVLIENARTPSALSLGLQLIGDGIDFGLPSIAVAPLATAAWTDFVRDSFDFGQVQVGRGVTDVVGYLNACRFAVGFRMRLSEGDVGFRLLPPTVEEGELLAEQVAFAVINFIPPGAGLAEDETVLEFSVGGVVVNEATLRLTGTGIEP